MTEQQKTRILDNGLVLLTESIPESEAASYVLRVPFGTVDDPADRQGLAGMIVEMIVRGAGEYNNQQLVYAFENFGIDASESVYQTHSSFGAAMLADRLNDSLALTADILFRPWFPEEELEPARQQHRYKHQQRQLYRHTSPWPWRRRGGDGVEGAQRVGCQHALPMKAADGSADDA